MGSDKPGTMGLEWWQFWLVRVKSSTKERAVRQAEKAWDAAPLVTTETHPLLTASESALPGDSLLLGTCWAPWTPGPTWTQPSGP